MIYKHTIAGITYLFQDLKTVLAKASPLKSGDTLAGIAANSAIERVAAQYVLADLPLRLFLSELVIPYEIDNISRLIIDSHDALCFDSIAHLTVGDLREWLLSDDANTPQLNSIAKGITPEMAAAVSKLMSIQDMILVSSKCNVVSKFRNTIGIAGTFSTRLQPNHPTDDPKGIAASIIDGLLYGSGDAMIGINPATDNVNSVIKLLKFLDAIRIKFEIPTQNCVLSHITTTMQAIERNAPVDLVFQSIAGSQKANESFGITVDLIKEAQQAGLELNRNLASNQIMYFETGQGSAFSSNAHHDVDQQTLECRSYGLARVFNPFLVNSVVGFIGPEYLYDGKQIQRAGIEDHFCGKLLGLPMGVDVCYTNHMEADQDDMDVLITLLGAAGVNFLMGVPGADDIMLNYQSTSFHDALYVRKLFKTNPAPEFKEWLLKMNLINNQGKFLNSDNLNKILSLV